MHPDAELRNLAAKRLNTVTWIINSEGKIDHDDWLELTGLEPSENPASRVKAIHPEDRRAAYRAWLKAYRSKTTYGAGYRLRLADHSYHRFVARAAPHFNADGSVRQWVGVSVDIDAVNFAPKAFHLLRENDGNVVLVSGRHIRAARAGLGWSVSKLAEAAGLPKEVIERFESASRYSTLDRDLTAVHKAFLNAGISLIARGEGKVGIEFGHSDLTGQTEH